MRKNIKYVGAGIDRLVVLDVRARGVIYNLYDAAKELVKAPITLTAAQKITDTIKNGSVAIITTGFIVLPKKVQETDGPLGAAALAKCLNVTFNAFPIIVTEEQSKEIMASALRALKFNVETDEKKRRLEKRDSALVLGFPLTPKAAEKEAERILTKFKPSLVIAVEKAGRNVKGEYHTMRGINITPFHAKIETLIEKARAQGILTVGIGDGGNEVGMGNIRNAIEKFVPYATTCQCPCKGGIAAESKVDILVAASISNWGAYGIEACIAALTGRGDALHGPEEEEKMLKTVVNAGAVDGVTGKLEASVDGVPMEVHLSIIKILREFVKNSGCG